MTGTPDHAIEPVWLVERTMHNGIRVELRAKPFGRLRLAEEGSAA